MKSTYLFYKCFICILVLFPVLSQQQNIRAAVECIDNAECAQGKTCMRSKCIDLCQGMCGKNAVCVVDSFVPLCYCKVGYDGDPLRECEQEGIRGCTTSSDCLLDQACIEQRCSDPCLTKDCGPNSGCRTSNHEPHCLCLPGYVRSPDGTCILGHSVGECIKDPDCGTGKICVKNKCVDPCQGACGLNATCVVQDLIPVCSCKSGYRGDPIKECKPEFTKCTTSSQCRLDEECIKHQCSNPCLTRGCGPNTVCRVVDHRQTCSCLRGYVYIPTEGCVRIYNGSAECMTSSQCPLDKACIKQRCSDPCLFVACGPNSVCRGANHKASCACLPGYVFVPNGGCKSKYNGSVECTTSYQCPLDKACIQQRCSDPCLFVACGPNSVCRRANHKASCECLPGYVFGSNGVCIPRSPVGECTKNSDCGAGKICVDGKCVDPCQGACGLNTNCVVRNRPPVCSCKPGYHGDPFTECKPEFKTCTTSSQCPMNKACIQNRCSNPCRSIVCGPNSVCHPANHRASCACLPGYVFNPIRGCIPEPPVGECTKDSDCGASKICEDGKCVDPCQRACGLNTVCVVHDHAPVCSCKPGYHGDPFKECIPDAGTCSTNAQCPSDKACIEHRCSDPCLKIGCGINTVCRVINHHMSCACLPGYVFNPTGDCVPGTPVGECTKDSDCVASKICADGKCVDPCQGACGLNTDCVVHNRAPVCSCKPGYHGDPYKECIPVGQCIKDSDCGANKICRDGKCVDPCQGACGLNTDCVVQNRAPVCSCKPGYDGDPFTECKPDAESCHVNAQCDSDKKCIEHRCVDPCLTIRCGPNSVCHTKHHRQSCDCLPGYVHYRNHGCVRERKPEKGKQDLSVFISTIFDNRKRLHLENLINRIPKSRGTRLYSYIHN